MKNIALLMASLLLNSCATNSPEALVIRSHEQYKKLSYSERILVEKIMSKAEKSSKKTYYFLKLTLLLDTKDAEKASTENNNSAKILKSVEKTKQERQLIADEGKIDINEYTNQEEIYETLKVRQWELHCPPTSDSCFSVSKEDPTDILINIQVHLEGEREWVERVVSLEDAIEKRLSVIGFNVNLIFVGRDYGDDVFNVRIDLGSWPSDTNWATSDLALGHELFHLFGLPDEYDRIESHAGNQHLPVGIRLRMFLYQMDNELPADSKEGIMRNMSKKPLDRQICAAVGLGNDCVNARRKYREIMYERQTPFR